MIPDPRHLLFSVSHSLQLLLSPATGLDGGGPAGSRHLLSLLPSLPPSSPGTLLNTLSSTFLEDSAETDVPVLRMALQTPPYLSSLPLLSSPVPRLNRLFPG